MRKKGFDKEIGLGVLDVHTHKIEKVEDVVKGIELHVNDRLEIPSSEQIAHHPRAHSPRSSGDTDRHDPQRSEARPRRGEPWSRAK